ncbi:MAG: YebC/PmpR family DNA-binding transcriptional regulator [Bacteroidota bacterium]
MAGHNKWSKIKRKKGVADARRSKVWARITRDIMVAARDGGGDPDMNARLGLAVEKAKAENMPKDNIERAIKRGTGEIEGADYEELTYEGYAPHGIAVYVEVLTDNTNRTVADLRSLFSKAGGNLGTSGSVAFLFDQKAVFEIPARGPDDEPVAEDDLFLLVADAGAEDLRRDEASGEDASGEVFVVEAPADAFGDVQSALAGADIEPSEAGLVQIPTTTTALASGDAATVLRLLDALDDHQDVQAVYSTLEMDDATLASLP